MGELTCSSSRLIPFWDLRLFSLGKVFKALFEIEQNAVDVNPVGRHEIPRHKVETASVTITISSRF